MHYDKKEIKKYSTWYMPEINKPTIKNTINIEGALIKRTPKITRINDARLLKNRIGNKSIESAC